MAMEYPDGGFVRNALVFAPGKTILESLRELLAAPYESILPPRFHRPFAASVKFTFTRDGEKDIPVIRGSAFNVVVTNTEKIRIQKETIRRGDLGGLLGDQRVDEARQEVANRRLQAIASLPDLAVFSDEAHHTYGQSLDRELKKVRKTVDYLHTQTSLVCVVNTTGTPYFERHPLRDVVIWYGLSQGIRDNILKDVSGSIHEFDFGGFAARRSWNPRDRSMSRDDANILDMLKAARLITQFVAGLSEDVFLAAVEKQSALLYQLTVLGEAARRVSSAYRQEHPEVEWQGHRRLPQSHRP